MQRQKLGEPVAKLAQSNIGDCLNGFYRHAVKAEFSETSKSKLAESNELGTVAIIRQQSIAAFSRSARPKTFPDEAIDLRPAEEAGGGLGNPELLLPLAA